MHLKTTHMSHNQTVTLSQFVIDLHQIWYVYRYGRYKCHQGSKMSLFENQDGGGRHSEKYTKGHISANSWSICIKFCMLVDIGNFGVQNSTFWKFKIAAVAVLEIHKSVYLGQFLTNLHQICVLIHANSCPRLAVETCVCVLWCTVFSQLSSLVTWSSFVWHTRRSSHKLVCNGHQLEVKNHFCQGNVCVCPRLSVGPRLIDTHVWAHLWKSSDWGVCIEVLALTCVYKCPLSCPQMYGVSTQTFNFRRS